MCHSNWILRMYKDNRSYTWYIRTDSFSNFLIFQFFLFYLFIFFCFNHCSISLWCSFHTRCFIYLNVGKNINNTNVILETILWIIPFSVIHCFLMNFETYSMQWDMHWVSFRPEDIKLTLLSNAKSTRICHHELFSHINHNKNHTGNST